MAKWSRGESRHTAHGKPLLYSRHREKPVKNPMDVIGRNPNRLGPKSTGTPSTRSQTKESLGRIRGQVEMRLREHIAALVQENEELRTKIAEGKEVGSSLAERAFLEALRADVGTALRQKGTLREILQKCAEAMVLHLDAAFVRIWTLNPGDQILEMQASAGMYTHIDGFHSRVDVGQFKIGLIAQGRKPHLTNAVIGDPRVHDQEWAKREGMVAFAGYPLIVEDRIIGVMALFARRRLTETVLEAMGSVAVAIAQGIDRKWAEEKLVHLYEQTRRQAAELEKSNKIKSEFLGVMSHEFRTPLNIVMGYIAMIKNGMLGQTNQGQEKALERVLKHCEELLAMIDSVLEASRIEAGRAVVEKRAIYLPGFLDDLRSICNVPPDKDLTLVWDYPPDLPVLKSDAEKLRDILRNLIDNGIKFTEKGSVTVYARHIPEAKSVELKVVDTGIGIDNENLPVIFDMFRQVDGSESRCYGGVGLGLYIAKKFTEMLGGSIQVESESGNGSTFTVILPCR